MGDTSAATLVFVDQRQAGAYPVTDPSGAVVARVRSVRGGARFVAEDAAGSPLCAGATGWWGMSNLWRATGSAGEPLLEVRKSMLRATAALRLARGGGMVVEGSPWRRDFQVRDNDRVVLSGLPQRPVLSLRPYEYAVVRLCDALTLAETVAVVQIWRQLRKRDDANSAAAASAAVIASS
jgi:uncharacterized protein YxjI